MEKLKLELEQPTAQIEVPLSMLIYELDGVTYARASSMGPIPQQAILIKILPIVKGG